MKKFVSQHFHAQSTYLHLKTSCSFPNSHKIRSSHANHSDYSFILKESKAMADTHGLSKLCYLSSKYNCHVCKSINNYTIVQSLIPFSFYFLLNSKDVKMPVHRLTPILFCLFHMWRILSSHPQHGQCQMVSSLSFIQLHKRPSWNELSKFTNALMGEKIRKTKYVLWCFLLYLIKRKDISDNTSKLLVDGIKCETICHY